MCDHQASGIKFGANPLAIPEDHGTDITSAVIPPSFLLSLFPSLPLPFRRPLSLPRPPFPFSLHAFGSLFLPFPFLILVPFPSSPPRYSPPLPLPPSLARVRSTTPKRSAPHIRDVSFRFVSFRLVYLPIHIRFVSFSSRIVSLRFVLITRKRWKTIGITKRKRNETFELILIDKSVGPQESGQRAASPPAPRPAAPHRRLPSRFLRTDRLVD